MSSRRDAAKGLVAASGGSPSVKGKGSMEGSASGNSSTIAERLSANMANVAVDPEGDGNWEVYTKKSRNKGGSGGAKSQGNSNAARSSWGQQRAGGGANGAKNIQTENVRDQSYDARKQGGRGTCRPQPTGRNWESAYMAPPASTPSVAPPLQNGWQWAARSGSSSQKQTHESGSAINGAIALGESAGGYESETGTTTQQLDDSSDEHDFAEDSDDDLSNGYGSDASEKDHETKKKKSWFRAFFDELDMMPAEQITDPTRQWHCPACKDGPGAIDWYKGILPLITHAKTKGAKRVKLHRELASLLDEELQRRGASATTAGEVFGKWNGLQVATTDHEIVWPPMVIIMNTLLDKDDNDKWLGMGNQELVDHFRDYKAQKGRHSYGPQGHRGMSVLIFEASAVSYLEAERLHKHFVNQGTDRKAWERPSRQLFYPGGKRQLYGFLACKEDMDVFNQHCQGKSKLKFEMKSYQEMVVSQMRQMNEDNQQLVYFKNQIARKELDKKTLEESIGVVSQKLRETMEENRIVRERTAEQYKENKLEMDYQEKFFKEQTAKVHKATQEKEKHFEKLLQEERAKAKQTDVNCGTEKDNTVRKEKIAKFIDSQVKGVEEFETAREELMHAHEEKRVTMRRRHLEEEVELEKEFDASLTRLMEKYAPQTFGASAST